MTAERSMTPEDLATQREELYRDLPQVSLRPLWDVLSDALTPEPRVRSVPYCWHWQDVRPRILRAGDLVTAEEAERRVLMLVNPGLEGRPAATATLYAGIQLILPGEVARTHHHTPAAVRFIIEGEGAYTAVNGEQALMHKGDYL
ncbi:MAG: cupin domain-containing protein, partial [Dehalococcoidia bacterium]